MIVGFGIAPALLIVAWLAPWGWLTLITAVAAIVLVFGWWVATSSLSRPPEDSP